MHTDEAAAFLLDFIAHPRPSAYGAPDCEIYLPNVINSFEGLNRAGRALAQAEGFFTTRSTVLKQVECLDSKASCNARNVVDGYVSFRPLDCAQISSVDAAFVGQRLLAQTTRSPKPSHVLREDIPEGSFVRPFHGRNFRRLMVLRRPL